MWHVQRDKPKGYWRTKGASHLKKKDKSITKVHLQIAKTDSIEPQTLLLSNSLPNLLRWSKPATEVPLLELATTSASKKLLKNAVISPRCSTNGTAIKSPSSLLNHSRRCSGKWTMAQRTIPSRTKSWALKSSQSIKIPLIWTTWRNFKRLSWCATADSPTAQFSCSVWILLVTNRSLVNLLKPRITPASWTRLTWSSWIGNTIGYSKASSVQDALQTHRRVFTRSKEKCYRKKMTNIIQIPPLKITASRIQRHSIFKLSESMSKTNLLRAQTKSSSMTTWSRGRLTYIRLAIHQKLKWKNYKAWSMIIIRSPYSWTGSSNWRIWGAMTNSHRFLAARIWITTCSSCLRKPRRCTTKQR